MKSYDEYKAQIESTSNIPDEVELKYVYIVYKEGIVIGTYTSASDATTQTKTGGVFERVCTNREEYDAYWDTFREIESQAYKLWYADLREEYSFLSDKVFELCYSQAYERGHSSGHDEVANCMIDVADFAEKILATKS